PLQSLPISNYTNSLCNIRDEYPNIYVTRIKLKKPIEYHYKVLRLGYYLSHIKMTKRTTADGFNGKVKFIVNWVSNKNKEESITSKQSASHAVQLFLKKLRGNENSRLSGIILFGVDLNCLDQRRINAQAKSTQSRVRKKEYNDLKSELQRNKQLKILGEDVHNSIKLQSMQYNFQNANLEHLTISLDNSTDSLDNIEILPTDIENGAYRSLTALLSIIIPTLVNKAVISHDD
ncbi:14494_t:CDS:2, partial [Gigaspora rosea]